MESGEWDLGSGSEADRPFTDHHSHSPLSIRPVSNLHLLVSLSLVAIAPTRAQQPLTPQQLAQQAVVRAAYSKREVRIRMRDGTQLFTSIYTPRDTTRAYPILLER